MRKFQLTTSQSPEFVFHMNFVATMDEVPIVIVLNYRGIFADLGNGHRVHITQDRDQHPGQRRVYFLLQTIHGIL